MTLSNIERHKKNLQIKPVLFGILGGFALLIVYISIVTVAESFSHAINELLDSWFLIGLLVLGFGIQVGLYTYIKIATRIKSLAGTSVAAAGGVSTTSMIACCAHHVTDVFPILGVSVAAVFLNQFQTLFMVIGVLSNLVGINIMLKIIQENQLFFQENGIFKTIFRFNMKKMLLGNAAFSAIIFLFVLYISL